MIGENIHNLHFSVLCTEKALSLLIKTNVGYDFYKCVYLSTLVCVKMAKLDDTFDLLQKKVDKSIPNLLGRFFQGRHS